MPGGPLAHVCFLVKDLEMAIDNWTKILSVFDPAQLEQPIVRQRWESGDDVMEVATFANPNGCEIQLLSPVGTEGPVARRLAKHGEGVHHLCFTHQNLPEAVGQLQEKHIELTSSELATDVATPWQAWTFVTPSSGSGLFIELAYPYKPVDGEWTPAYDVDATGPTVARS
jgi:methylmalonyl-CoA/ethylmalonyl-CoA epimerase